MSGISKRIVSFAKFYNQLKFLVAVISLLVKQDAECNKCEILKPNVTLEMRATFS
jgi:hypothetical protein